MKYCPKCSRKYADDYDAGLLNKSFQKGQCDNMACVVWAKNNGPFELTTYLSPGLPDTDLLR